MLVVWKIFAIPICHCAFQFTCENVTLAHSLNYHIRALQILSKRSTFKILFLAGQILGATEGYIAVRGNWATVESWSEHYITLRSYRDAFRVAVLLHHEGMLGLCVDQSIFCVTVNTYSMSRISFKSSRSFILIIHILNYDRWHTISTITLIDAAAVEAIIFLRFIANLVWVAI